MYQQAYGYMPYGAYSMPSSPLPLMGHDGQLHALQEYYYPSTYYQPPQQTSQTDASQVEVSTADDQASLSTETNTGNLSTTESGGGLSGNNGTGSQKSTFTVSSLNPNASYKRESLLTGNLTKGHQNSRFSYEGVQPTIPWLDMSVSSNGQTKHTANSGFSSYAKNLSSGRNGNLHPFPHFMVCSSCFITWINSLLYGYLDFNPSTCTNRYSISHK